MSAYAKVNKLNFKGSKKPTFYVFIMWKLQHVICLIVSRLDILFILCVHHVEVAACDLSSSV